MSCSKTNRLFLRNLIFDQKGQHLGNYSKNIFNFSGHMNCAILLLDAGCRVNHRDHLSETALLLLLRHAFENIDLAPDPLVIFCDLLLQYGANPRLPGMKLQTAVTLANAMINRSFENTLCHSLGKYLYPK